jgi:hypothetical protein
MLVSFLFGSGGNREENDVYRATAFVARLRRPTANYPRQSRCAQDSDVGVILCAPVRAAMIRSDHETVHEKVSGV